MERTETLLIPGPTPVPDRVVAAMNAPMINHRGEKFTALQREIQEGLQEVFQSRAEVIVMPGSGTGALEAAIVNTLSPGDRVLACTAGAFGERFAKIAAAHGAEVERLEAPWGQAIRPEALADRLQADRDRRIKAVLLTHNETSTGVTHPVAELAAAVREHGALVLVDAVSSLGAIDLRPDEWGIDVVATGSQKALMLPPGLAITSVSARAWAAADAARMPRFYWDWRGYRKEWLQVPYTPALSLLFGLRESLRMIREEGLQRVFARHAETAAVCRAGVEALGLRLFADPAFASNAVTAIHAPDGIDVGQLRKAVARRGFILAGGQGGYATKLFRIGHLGHIREQDVRGGLTALREALDELGAARR